MSVERRHATHTTNAAAPIIAKKRTGLNWFELSGHASRETTMCDSCWQQEPGWPPTAVPSP